jgi:methionyl-tRNA formyltransferase
LKPVGVVGLDRHFSISYRPSGVTNVRFRDMEGWAATNGVPHRRYTGTSDIAKLTREQKADFLLAAGWYHMIPAAVRQHFARGAAGIHASLLPKLRGGAPLNWAILTRAPETGVSLFELSDGVDDGPLYGQKSFPIGASTTVGELVAASREAALDLISECLPAIASGRLAPWPQEGAPSYGLQRVPEDGCIDWTCNADDIHCLIRAIGHPYPGAYTWLGDERILIWQAGAPLRLPVHGAPGQVFRIPNSSDVAVVTGDGLLALQQASTGTGEDALPLLRKSANRRLHSMTQ